MRGFKAIRAVLRVEAENPVTDYTGRLVKTLIYTLSKELRLLHGLRGMVAPLGLSPLFTMGRKELELGAPVTPQYLRNEEGEQVLVPTRLNGEYLIHIGGEMNAVLSAEKALEKIRTPLAIKFNDNIITFTLEKEEDVTSLIESKKLDADRLTVYLKAPTLIFNVFTSSRMPKFTPTAVEVLMTPYMLLKKQYTITPRILLEASSILGLLIETYYSLKTLKPIIIPYKGKKEATLTGKITYIIDTDNPHIKKEIEKLLATMEITGIGESRLNGFGTTTWTTK